MNILAAAGRRHVHPLATRADRAATGAAAGCRRGRPARIVRPAARAAQSRHGPDVDPLARPSHRRDCRWSGNLFCTACPMVLARDVGRRFAHPAWRWPRRLRGKWLGLALLVLVLFSYELFDLWAMPRATAWLVLGYFGLAIVVDVLFSGASFCKHLCPIGQFNFTASMMSPTELRIVDRETCRSCQTSDCIKGRFSGPVRPKPDTTPGARTARLRAGTLPADEGRQPRLHPLPRLRARLPARQHRARDANARRRAARTRTTVRHRPSAGSAPISRRSPWCSRSPRWSAPSR